MLDQDMHDFSLENNSYLAKHTMKVAKAIDNHIYGQWCMYFWIPQEIHMKKGKMAGQVAHASARLARMMEYEEWDAYTDYEIKIVYKILTIDKMFKVRDELMNEYPIEYQTIVFDNTWEKYTVFGIATKRDLKNKKWKLA